MVGIVKRDPWATLFNWPSEVADYYNIGQRGLHIEETDNAVIIEAVVAGIPAENVDVNIEDGVLTIKAQASEEKKEKGGESRSRRSYWYSTSLSGVDGTKAEAEIDNGVVKVTIPKAESAKPRKITVKAKGK